MVMMITVILSVLISNCALLLIIETLLERRLTCNDSHGQTYSDCDEEHTNVKYSKPDCPAKEGRMLSHLCACMRSSVAII